MVQKKSENRPPRLKKGDAVGIVAPASHFDRDTFHKGVEVLEAMGFHPVFDDRLYETDGYLAGSDDHRAGQINRFFQDSSIKGLICARGGFGCIRILPLIDLAVVRSNPKCFVGFSDITALLSLLYQQCRLPAFHGPNVTTLAKATPKSIEAFYTALTTDHSITIKAPRGSVLIPGNTTGMVLGGNLATLCHLLATPYQPDLANQILLLEDVEEAPYKIDRMLSQMKLAGCLDNISGLVLGAFTRCGKKDEIYRIIRERFEEYDIPILAGLPVGHGRSNVMIPLGLPATLDTDRKALTYHEPATVSFS